MRGQRSLCKQTTFEAADEPLVSERPATDLKVKSSDLKARPAEIKAKSLDKSSLVDAKKQTNGLVTKANSEDDGRRNGPVDDKPAATHSSRVRPLTKMKLLQRSHAMREETSPPPDPDAHSAAGAGAGQKGGAVTNNNSLSVRPPSRHKLSRQGSSRDSGDGGPSPCLTRENSSEQYTDFTGADLELFIVETINKNHKDRALMMQIESQLVNYIRDRSSMRQYYKFPVMSSYQRMLVHRVAAYFGMEHNVDQPGNCVVVSRTKSTRIPEVEFKQYVKEDLLFPDEPRRSILKRDSSSFEDASYKSPERLYGSDCRRSKSFEEREEEYEKARRRIFTKSCDEGGNGSHRGSPDWEFQPWSSSESEPSRRANNHLRADSRGSRMLKVESFEGGDTLKAGSLRGSVSKSYSFGGYSGGGGGGGARVDTASIGVGTSRTLIKQDSGSSVSSRISPSSSGYKSQSQRSDATLSATPSPTATPHGPPPPHASQLSPDNAVMWAVSDMAAVPPGSLLINPVTGLALTNEDGSIYRFDPDNPPRSKPDECKNAGTQVTPDHSQPPSPGKPPSPPHAAPQSKNTTTTSTSPSFPVTPPPPAPPAEALALAPPAYQYKPAEPAGPAHCHASQANVMGAYPAGMYSMQQQQVNPALMYNNQAAMPCHNQPTCPLVYPGYGPVGPYDPRQMMPAEGCGVPELNAYFMSVNLMPDQQRGAGDSANLAQAAAGAQAYQPQPAAGPQPAAAAAYCWQPHQNGGGGPMYYTVPHPGATPLLTSSPPSMPAMAAMASPRYVYSSYQPNAAAGALGDPTQAAAHNGNFMPTSSYALAGSYGGQSAGGECLAPAGMMYAPPGPYYPPAGPGGQSAGGQQFGGGAGGQPAQFRTPTPPQTPTHGQAMCGPSYVYLNGGPGYAAPQPYNGGPAPNGGPSPPGGAQYMPVMPGVGLFRPSMQMMRSSPPPPTRPPRDGGAGSKPPFSRSPSVGSGKERPFDGAPRYPPMPIFRMMPGDIRGLVGPPLQAGVRMQFPLPPHHPPSQHGGGQAGYAPDSRARKPRPKSLSGANGQSRGGGNQGHPSLQHHPGSYANVNNNAGRMSQPHQVNPGNGPPVKHH